MQSFGRRRQRRPDGEPVRLLDLTANCMTTPANVKFQSGPVARPCDRRPAALRSRRHSLAQTERLQTVLSGCSSPPGEGQQMDVSVSSRPCQEADLRHFLSAGNLVEINCSGGPDPVISEQLQGPMRRRSKRSFGPHPPCLQISRLTLFFLFA